MRKIFFIAVFFAAGMTGVSAQEVAQGRQWTLAECIEQAVESNIGVRQTALRAEGAAVNLNSSRMSRLPSLSAGMGQTFSFGRAASQIDNTYIDTRSSNSSLSASANVNLFGGFSTNNQIKADKLDLKAATAGLEAARESVELSVTGYYLDVLFKKEVLGVFREQTVLVGRQVDNTRVMFDEGRVSNAQLLDIEAQLADARVNEVTAENDLALSLLTLSQALNLSDGTGFDIAPVGEEVDPVPAPSPEAVYETAVGLRPSVRQAEYALESAHRKVKVAQGAYWPSLSLGASFSDGYYYMFGQDAAQQDLADQLRNKHGENIGLNLSIPIFNGNRARNNVRLARLSAAGSSLDLDAAKQELYKQIRQAWQTAVGARSGFEASSTALTAAEEAFRAMELRYNGGKATAYEYAQASTQLASARSDQARAKYNYLFSTRVLDFYLR